MKILIKISNRIFWYTIQGMYIKKAISNSKQTKKCICYIIRRSKYIWITIYTRHKNSKGVVSEIIRVNAVILC